MSENLKEVVVTMKENLYHGLLLSIATWIGKKGAISS